MAKKTKRKWNRTSKFKRKESNDRKVGHPVLVFKTSGNDYKYLTFTHKPVEGEENNFVKLKFNINENEVGKDSYVKRRADISPSRKFRNPDVKYRIHDDDKELIKQLKKQ